MEEPILMPLVIVQRSKNAQHTVNRLFLGNFFGITSILCKRATFTNIPEAVWEQVQ